jgi:type II secretory pathway pseudopilin PulG
VTGRDRTIVLIVLAVAAVVGAWLLVVQPKRDQASKLDKQVQTAQGQLSSARSQLAQAEQARNGYTSAYGELVRLGEAVPADDAVPSLIYELQSAASASHVDFRSLQLSPNSAGSSPTPASSSNGSGSSSNGSSSNGSSNGSSSSGSSSSATQLPPGAAVGPAGFPAEQFNFTFRGNFFNLADFFNRLQRLVVTSNNHVRVSGRLMTLNAISLAASPAGFPQISATVSATTYIVPQSQGLTNGATPTAPSTTYMSHVATSAKSAASGTPAAAVTPPVR